MEQRIPYTCVSGWDFDGLAFVHDVYTRFELVHYTDRCLTYGVLFRYTTEVANKKMHLLNILNFRSLRILPSSVDSTPTQLQLWGEARVFHAFIRTRHW